MDRLKDSNIQELVFEIEEAISPATVGASTDSRDLGIFVYSITFGADTEE